MRHLSRFTLLFLSASILVVVNQNCGDAGFKAAGTDSLSSGLGGSYSVVPSTSGVLKSWEDPFPALTDAGDCLSNPKFNLCVSDRDPVSVNGRAFSPALSTSTITNVQERLVFNGGLTVPTSPPVNSHYQLSQMGLTPVVARTGGSFKYSYLNDSNHNVGQLSVFYWVNRERAFFKERVGHFYFDAETLGHRSVIRAFINQENAFFDQSDSSLNFGYLQTAGNKAELALDSSVLVHEAGHGNFHSANRSGGVDTITICRTDGYCYCPTKNGCMRAIDEGIADIHSFIMFNGDAALGRFATNSMNGLRNAALDIQNNETADTRYADIPAAGFPMGEIHNLGQVYAEIWYSVWSAAKTLGLEKEVEMVFIEHLTDLTGNDTFQSAFRVINHTIDQVYPPSSPNATRAPLMKSAFSQAYTRMHLNTQ